MRTTERWTSWTGLAAVLLWVASIVVVNAGGAPAEDASEAELLAYVETEGASILAGGWLFMAGCAAFLWFAVALRERLAAAERGNGVFSTVAFVGAVVTGVLMMVTPGGEIAAAIVADEQEISGSTVAALRHLGEGLISAATLAATLLMVGSAVVALRTGLFPRGWAWFSLALAAVLVVPLIGWAALLLGLPVWVVGTAALLLRRPPLPAPAAA